MRALAELRTLVDARSNDEGPNLTAIPGLWFFRATRPLTRKKAQAKMVTLAVILQGQKEVVFTDVRYDYRPGSYLFVTGEQTYASRVKAAYPNEPYLSLALQFPPDDIGRAVVELSDAGECESLEDVEISARMERVDRLLVDGLIRLVNTLDDEVDQRVLAPIIRKELLVRMLRGPSGGVLRRAVRTDDGRIRRAATFIDVHADERLTVERVAREVSMSPSHFAHRFRDVMRMSPIQYQKHLRLRRARQLLVVDGLGAAEVASRVGYASPSHFARDFKSYFGAPPGTYAAQMRRGSGGREDKLTVA